MSKRINITIDDDLYEWVKNYRREKAPCTINVSAVCNESLRETKEYLEKKV